MAGARRPQGVVAFVFPSFGLAGETWAWPAGIKKKLEGVVSLIERADERLAAFGASGWAPASFPLAPKSMRRSSRKSQGNRVNPDPGRASGLRLPGRWQISRSPRW